MIAVVAGVAAVASLVGVGSSADDGDDPPAEGLSVERGDGEDEPDSRAGTGAGDPAPRPTPSGEAAPLEVVAGSWETLQQAPFEPRSSIPVAVGDALFVWGGAPWQVGGGAAFHDDGAVLRRKRWEALPPSPLEGRSGAAMAALDDRVVMWGGLARTAMLDDGAIYDLARRRWRRLPPAPLSPRTDAGAVWTGEEVVVVGGRDNAGPLFDAAAYDPDTDGWRSLPPSPAADRISAWGAPSLRWTGDVVVAQWSGPSGGGPSYRIDPDGGGWDPIEGPTRPISGAIALVGGEDALVAVTRTADGRPRSVSVRTADGWEEVEVPGSRPRARGQPPAAGAVVVDGRLFLLVGTEMLVLDLADRSWASSGELPTALRSADLAFVEGSDRVVVWSTTGGGAALWHPAVR